MAHRLIIGQTESGKTTLARNIIIPRAVESGIPVMVLDPMREEWPGASVYRDPERFLADAKRNVSRLLVIDESGTMVDKYDPRWNWITTTSRHLGHQAIVICHRLSQLSPTLRSQCSEVYMFATSGGDADVISEEFGEEPPGRKLQRGEFVVYSRFNSPLAGRTVRSASGAWSVEYRKAGLF